MAHGTALACDTEKAMAAVSTLFCLGSKQKNVWDRSEIDDSLKAGMPWLGLIDR